MKRGRPAVPIGTIKKYGNVLCLKQSKSRWVGIHRLRMEVFVGRKIPRSLRVHPLNGDITSTHIDNLLLCTPQVSNKLLNKNTSNKEKEELVAESKRKTINYKHTGQYV